MFITKMSLPRRTFLRGMGATRGAAAARRDGAGADGDGADRGEPAAPLRRDLHPARRDHGRSGRPAASGAGFEFTPILKPLEPFRDSARRRQQSRPRRGPGRRPRRARRRLAERRDRRSGPKGRTSTSDTTIDQIVAKQIGQDTPFPSLEVATEDFTGYVGACDAGYSCAYMNTISWASPTTPLPMEINPRVVFERMFGGGGHAGRAALAPHARGPQHPRLDHRRIARTLQRGLGARDRGAARASISTTSARSSAASSAPKQQAARAITVARRAGRRARSFEEHVAADVRPAGAGLSRPTSRASSRS